MMNKKYWNPKIETMDRSDIEKLQLKRLKHQLEYVYKNSAFFIV